MQDEWTSACADLSVMCSQSCPVASSRAVLATLSPKSISCRPAYSRDPFARERSEPEHGRVVRAADLRVSTADAVPRTITFLFRIHKL